MIKPMIKPGLVRLVLALIVVFHHLTRYTFLGEFAVDSFFVLSGYWITLMFDHKYSKKANELKVFYISRFWRVLPVFYIFTILGAIVLLAVGGLREHYNALPSTGDKSIFWLSNTTILTYYLSKLRILGPAWSLDIEMQFYLIFPFIYYAVKKNTRALLLLTGISFLMFLSIWLFFSDSLAKQTILSYVFLFLIGMVIYRLNVTFSGRTQRVGLMLFIGVLALQYTLLVMPATAHLFVGTLSGFRVLTLCALACALPTLANSVKVRSDERDKFYGEMSYLLYLSHWVWLNLYNHLIDHLTHKYLRLPYVALFLLVTLGSALAVYYLVDRTSERLRHRWVKAQREKKQTARTPEPSLVLAPSTR